MAVWSPLTTHWAVNNVDSHPRTSKVDTIIHHHAAGTDKLSALALFAPGGREVTPNYFVAGREIWGIVPEDRRAFTSGSPHDDQRGITYEVLNVSGAPDWRFSAETLDTVARLDADIAKRYGIPLRHAQPGFIEHRNIYEWFGRGYATACAGPSFNIGNMIAATASIINGGSSGPGSGDDNMERIIRTDKGDILVVDHAQMTYWNVHEGIPAEDVQARIDWLKAQGMQELHGLQPTAMLRGYAWVHAAANSTAKAVDADAVADRVSARILDALPSGSTVDQAALAKLIAKEVNDDAAERMRE